MNEVFVNFPNDLSALLIDTVPRMKFFVKFPKYLFALLNDTVHRMKFLGVNKPYVILDEISINQVKTYKKKSFYLIFKYILKNIFICTFRYYCPANKDFGCE